MKRQRRNQSLSQVCGKTICYSDVSDLWNMSEHGNGGEYQKRISGDGNNEAAGCEVWKRCARAALVVKKSRCMTPNTMGPWLYTMLDGREALALEAFDIKDLTVEDGEEVAFRELDERFHDKSRLVREGLPPDKLSEPGSNLDLRCDPDYFSSSGGPLTIPISQEYLPWTISRVRKLQSQKCGTWTMSKKIILQKHQPTTPDKPMP